MPRTQEGHLIIKNVRCSFPSLWKEDIKEDGSKFGKGIKILLDPTKDAQAIAEIKAEISKICKEKPKIKQVVEKKGEERMCLKTGDRDEYPAGCKMLGCGNPGKIMVLHKDRTRATEDDDPIYSGCYVNVKVDIWGQDNKYGKRINAKVITVQFAGEGESFDGGHVSDDVAASGFDSLDDDFGDATGSEGEDMDFL